MFSFLPEFLRRLVPFFHARCIRQVHAAIPAAIALTALLWLSATQAAAQIATSWPLHSLLGAPEHLVLSGSTRVRYETLAGQPRVGLSASDDLISVRTTLMGEYRWQGYRLGAEIYDSRAYGGDASGAVSANDVNAFEIVQAYLAFDWQKPFGEETAASLQAGRFLLNLGSRRLVAADDYRNTANAHTGLRADFSGANIAATLIYMLPQIRLPDDKPSVLENAFEFDRESFDLILWGGIVIVNQLFGSDTAFDMTSFHIREQDSPLRPTRDRSLGTVGARIFKPPGTGAFDYELEGIYQYGHLSDNLAVNAPERHLSAWFVHFDAGYTVDIPWRPRISLEYDHASGDGTGATNTRFDFLFGMRRADLAPAGIYAAIGRTNIITPALRIEASPSRRFDWFVNYRLLWLDSPRDVFSTTGVSDPTGESGHFAGQQIEGRMRYWILPQTLLFELNAVALIKGQYLRVAPNAPSTGNTRYTSFNLTAYF